MKLYWNLLLNNLKSQMQYRLSFFLTSLGQFLSSFAALFGLSFILERVDAVDGFSFGQVLLCFAVVMMAFSLGELVGGGLARFPRLLGDGAFDRALVRPRSVILQIVVPQMDFARLGISLQAALVLAYAIPASGVDWTPAKAATLCLMILCGAALFFCLFLLYAACAFFTTKGLEALNLLTYGARQFGRYPFSVYGKGALGFFTFIIPLALIQYYPLLYLTGRASSPLFALLPLASLLFVFPCFAFFRFGLRNYRSTGS